MPFDPNGTASLPPSTWATPGQTIRTEQHNPPFRDIEQMLSAVLKRDGRDGMVGALSMNGFSVTGMRDAVGMSDAVTLGQLMALIASMRVPVGVAAPLTGMVVPQGWLRANGQSRVRAIDADLWTFAQSSGNLASSEETKTPGQYGPGDGTTTFTLPNLEADGGYFIRPVSSGRGVGTVQQDEIKSHGHGVSDPGHTHPYTDTVVTVGGAAIGGAVAEWFNNPMTKATSSAKANITINNTGGDETRPKNIAYPVIIKA